MSETYLISIIVNIFVGIASGFILFRLKKRDMRTEENERKRSEKEVKREAENFAMRTGICALLRDRLLQSCLHFEKLGYVPPKELENISRMYSAYHDLGGNDMITILYTEVVNLPHTAPDEKGGE